MMMAVVPPWQNPDEPQHVMFASVLAKQGPAVLPNLIDTPIEGEIIVSMARHRWWTLYEREMPVPLPPNFFGSDVEVHSIRGQATYYLAAAALFNRLPPLDVVAQLHLLRSVSALFGLATLWCVWAGTRLQFGRAAACAVAAVLALHPQFAIVSTTASPDAVVNLLGAIVWWQAARAHVHAGRPAMWAAVAVCFAAAVMAFATARLGLPLVVASVFITVRMGLRLRSLSGLRTGLVAPAILGLAAALIAVAAWFLQDLAVRASRHAMMPIRNAIDNWSAGWPEPVPFFRVVADSFWLTAGWLRFPAHAAVMIPVHTFVAIAVGGVLRGWRRRPELRPAVARSVVFVVLQMAAIVFGFYFTNVGAQGRYLFPAIGPLLALLWFGGRIVLPRMTDLAFTRGAVVAALLFDLLGWYTVLLPAFA
jgi:4-amino-4-deoxy-L-arabinose transferase-like glycosyltransferase